MVSVNSSLQGYCIAPSFVNSWVLSCLFQCGWCLLKLPSQIMCADPCIVNSSCLAWSHWNFDSTKIVLLCSQSLYILKIVSFSQVLVSCTTVTSLKRMSICSQLSVQNAAHISIMDLVLAGFTVCVVGYSTIQSLLAMVFSK